MESKRSASEVVDRISDELLKGLIEGSTEECRLAFEHEVLGKLDLEIFKEEKEIFRIIIGAGEELLSDFHVEETEGGWCICHRHVDRDFQRNGLGTLNMLLIEKIVGLSKNKILIADVSEAPVYGGEDGNDLVALYGIQADYLELVLSNGFVPDSVRCQQIVDDVRAKVGFTFLIDPSSGLKAIPIAESIIDKEREAVWLVKNLS